MDEENQINDKLKIMKFSLLPSGLKHTPFIYQTEFNNIWAAWIDPCSIQNTLRKNFIVETLGFEP